MKVKKVRLSFEPRDLWIGCYWLTDGWGLTLYFCLVPCFPLRIDLEWRA